MGEEGVRLAQKTAEGKKAFYGKYLEEIEQKDMRR